LRAAVYFLGTSAGIPTRNRGLPCIALKYRGDILLFDIGEGSQAKFIRAGLSPLKVKAIFITHLHGDHIFGLPGLLQTMSMLNRKEPLYIYGPRGLKEFIEEIFKLTKFKPQFNLNIFEPPNTYETNDYIVRCFPVEHIVEAYGYVFEEKHVRGRFNPEKAKNLNIPLKYWKILRLGHEVRLSDGRVVKPEEVIENYSRGVKVVYTGDTRPIDTVAKMANKCDLLIHDSTFSSELKHEAYGEGHSTSIDAAKIANDCKAKVLILTHISARYHENPFILLHEARRFFPHTFLAEDYMIYILT